MANTNSPNITLLEASPREIADRRVSGSAKVIEKGTVEFTANANDTLVIARVPVDATLDSLRFAFDDLGGTITLDGGFYQVPVDGASAPGTVVDQNALMTLVSASSAVTMTENRFETQEINTIAERMWELANLADRPSYEQFDFALTVVTGTTPTVGTVSWYIEYTL